MKTRLSERTRAALRCPVCKSELTDDTNALRCANAACGVCFPLPGGVAVLLNESNSLFRIEDYTKGNETFFRPANTALWKRLLIGWLPACSLNIKAEQNLRLLERKLLEFSPNPTVLIIGGSVKGEGIGVLYDNPNIECVSSDIALSPLVDAVVDSHDIPLADNSIDAVVVTAVLEHVIDPYRCVAEIHRVLKPGGLVYAETPFMQQVHGGRYDYVRFTDLGHRRLFRDFEEIERGVAVGPGSALMWSVNAFMRTVFRRHLFKQLATAAVQATLFWLRYFDYYLVDRPAAADCASGYYFLGRKSDKPLSDKELLEQYRGACYELRAY